MLGLVLWLLVGALLDNDEGGLQFRKEVQSLNDIPSGLRTITGGRGGALVLIIVGFWTIDPERNLGSYLWPGAGGRTSVPPVTPKSITMGPCCKHHIMESENFDSWVYS